MRLTTRDLLHDIPTIREEPCQGVVLPLTFSGVWKEFSSRGSSLVMVVTQPALLNASPATLSSDTLTFCAADPKLTICANRELSPRGQIASRLSLCRFVGG